MLSWTIQITIISIVLIFLIHHLINFFKSALTVPKIKDLVNVPHKKYENIFNVINNSNNKTDNSDNNSNDNNKYELDIEKLLPKNEVNMKNELKNFIKKQFNNTQNSTSISNLDSYLDNSGTNNYSFI
jgi:hypothetical protein